MTGFSDMGYEGGQVPKAGASGLSVKPRDPFRNPHNQHCELHLQRVCGVCLHFAGDLRGDGQCQQTQVAMRGRRQAGDCPWWSRKTAGVK